jgi:hypothetical protein
MKAVLLGLAAGAALIVPAAPASAVHWSDPTFIAAANVQVHRGPTGGSHDVNAPPAGRRGDFRRHGSGGHDGRRHRDRDDDFADGGWWYYPQDFDGNRSFDPDKFNDWWHERTWRSFPRWTQNNQNCERVYWTGAGWRC